MLRNCLRLLVFFLLIQLGACSDGLHAGQQSDPQGDATAERPLSAECVAKLPGEIKRSPALTPDGDVVVLLEPDQANGPRLVKLTQDGTLLWTALLDTNAWSLASPPVVRLNGEILVTLIHPDEPGQLLRVAGADGAVIRRIELNKGPSFAPAPLPPGPILITSGDELIAFDAQGQRLWSKSFAAPVSSDVVVGTAKFNLLITKEDDYWSESNGHWMIGYQNVGKQRMAAFGSENGKLALLMLGEQSPHAPTDSREIPLYEPTSKAKRPSFVRQPGAFDQYNLLFVVAEDHASMAVAPEGSIIWAQNLPKSRFTDDVYAVQYGLPAMSPNNIAIIMSPWDASLISIDYTDCIYKWEGESPGDSEPQRECYGPSFHLYGDQELPISPLPSTVTTSDNHTYVVYRSMLVSFRNEPWADPNIEWVSSNIGPAIWTSAVLSKTGLFFGGGDSGCVVRVARPLGPVELDRIWPRYRYDNRNSAVRWEPAPL